MRYRLALARHYLSRIPCGGRWACLVVGHRWESWSTPCPEPDIESLRQLHGWRCTRCPKKRRFGDR